MTQDEKTLLIEKTLSTDEGIEQVAKQATSNMPDPGERERQERFMVSLMQSSRRTMRVIRGF